MVDPSCFRIAVRDSGVGIEPARLRELFSAFTKIQRHRELNSDGCGLGLTISKKLALAMGGDIAVQSIPGSGSVFTVTVPIRLVDLRQTSFHKLPGHLFETQKKPSQDSSSLDENTSGFTVYRGPQKHSLQISRAVKSRELLPHHKRHVILVVDDDPFNVEGLKALLSLLCSGSKVHCAFDGQQALIVLQSLAYRVDLVITDFQMPVMNGVRFAQELRQLQEDGVAPSRLQIVVASGMNLANEDQSFLIDGMMRPLFDHRMQKPFSSRELKRLLDDLAF